MSTHAKLPLPTLISDTRNAPRLVCVAYLVCAPTEGANREQAEGQLSKMHLVDDQASHTYQSNE